MKELDVVKVKSGLFKDLECTIVHLYPDNTCMVELSDDEGVAEAFYLFNEDNLEVIWSDTKDKA